MTISEQTEQAIWSRGAGELAASIARGDVSARAVVGAHLDRIAQVNPDVNAITAVLAESALADADRVDAAIGAGERVGPLAGVPFTIKENLDVAGQPTTDGVVAFRERIATVDAPMVSQLRRAGAIPLARTNMPDFGMRWHTDNALFGATRNPWDGALSPGGSSGGEAVALATGMSPLGLGNDYGGSLRLPAMAAGIIGLRPTAGRIARATSTNPFSPTPTLQLFAVDGPMARQVDDVRLVYQQVCGHDARDPLWVPAPAELPVPQPLRVAVCTDPGGQGVDPVVAAAVRRCANALADAGAVVQEVQLPHLMEAAQLWRTLITAEMRGLLEELVRPLGSADAATSLTQSLDHVPALDLAGYIGGLARRHAIAHAWSMLYTAHDVVLGPVGTQRIQPVGFDLGGPDNADALWHAHRLVVAVNLLGLPALAVPAGQDPHGIPAGIQLIADRFRENTCLTAGQLIEQALGTITPINPRPAAVQQSPVS